MKKVQLLHENQINTLDLATSDLDMSNIVMAGIFLQPDVKNGNNRRYPSRWFNPYIQKHIVEGLVKKGRAVGELDHPEYIQVSPEKMTHKITSLELKEDGNWYGQLKVLDNPLSSNVQQIRASLKEGIPLGVSSRAVGSTEYVNGEHIVLEEGFYMSTPADIVLDPSAPDAYVNAINEGKFYLWEGNSLVEYNTDMAKKTLDRKYRQTVSEDDKRQLLEGIIKEIMSKAK